MAVTFVIGRAGSGKTRRCFHSVVEMMRADPLGRPIYWVVPKQATFQAERDLTCRSGLAGFCRARVVSFESLGREIFAHAGGNVVPEVTPLGRQMVLGHLLRRLEQRLHFFRSSARQPGLAAELDATFAELERSGKTATDLAALLPELELTGPIDVDGAGLLAKLRDLRLLYDAYTGFLGQDRLDPHRRLQQVLATIANYPPLQGATVYVDGFLEFSEHERKVLAGVAEVCERLEITLLVDPDSPTVRDPHKLPDEMSLFHRTERTYRRLWFTFAEEGVPVTEPVVLREPHRFSAAPALAAVEASMFGGPSQPVAGAPEQIELLTAPDRRAAVDAAARRVRALLREGLRLRDVAVLVRDLEPYHGLIDVSFREHGIPYFVDRRRTAAHHPLVRFVRAVFQIARFEWPHDAVMALLKSGLAGVSLYEADGIENYVLVHRIRGLEWEKAEPWAYNRSLTLGGDDEALTEGAAGTEARTIDSLRRGVARRLKPLIDLLRFGKAVTVRAVATELFNTLERFEVRQTLSQWAAVAGESAQFEQQGEHEQVWAELVELFEQMVDLLGGEAVTPADFVDIFESGLERFDLALVPPTVDQVLVGEVERTRTPELKAVLVLGLNAGEFPRGGRETSVLSDVDRRELGRRRLELDPDANRRALDETLLGYLAFTRTGGRLIASRPLSDDAGRPTEPSPFWHRLREMFPGLTPVEVPRERAGDARLIDTPRQLVVSLMQWVRRGRTEAKGLRTETGPDPSLSRQSSVLSPDSPDPWPALYQWLAGYDCRDDAIDSARYHAWRALSYSNEAELSPEVASRLFRPPLEATARQLETFATCPFQHFLRYGLKLQERDAQTVTAVDLSRVYHQVLDIVVSDVLESRRDWQDLSSLVPPETIHTYAEAVGQMLRGELMLSSARNKYLLDRVERTLADVLAAQCEFMKRGSFRPGFTAVEFGEKGRLPALRIATPGGAEVLLHGKIDRVDLLPGGTEFAVYDYKLGADALALGRVYHGLSLQLLTYLLVLQANGQDLTDRPLTPAAAFYLQLSRRLGDVDHPSEALDPANPRFHLRCKPRGVFDGKYFPALDKGYQGGDGWSEVVAARVNADGQFGDRNKSDVADPAEFAALLGYVRRRVGELADQILAGVVDIAPYRINRESPCPRCAYRGVCRFEPDINRYHFLTPLNREGVFRKLTEGTSEGEPPSPLSPPGERVRVRGQTPTGNERALPENVLPLTPALSPKGERVEPGGGHGG